MEIIQLQPSPENAETNPTRQTQMKRPRRPFTGEGPIPVNKRVRIPPICIPAFFHLKQELGLRSHTETVQWLLHEVRPQLVPATKPPNSSQNLPSRNVVSDCFPRPVCMEHLNNDKLVSYVPVASSGAPAARQPVRATVVQASTVFFDTPATMDKAERLIAGAAAYGSQLVVFPEAFLGGYPRFMMRFVGGKDDHQKYYASAINVPGPEVDRLAKIAGKYKVHLVMGVVERAGLYLFSTLVFLNSMGQYVGQQRKLMPMPSECALWSAGEKKSPLPVYETSIGKMGGLICWDNKSPLLRSELYAQGVEIYCAPSADSREAWKASMIHIALEGCCFVLSANQFCRRGDYPLPPGDSAADISVDEITCSGGSVIVSPSGNILAGPNYQGECLISADLDIVEITRAKMEFGIVGNSVEPNHDNWTASEADPVLFATNVKEVPIVPNQPSR